MRPRKAGERRSHDTVLGILGPHGQLLEKTLVCRQSPLNLEQKCQINGMKQGILKSGTLRHRTEQTLLHKASLYTYLDFKYKKLIML